ncbi:hypothetical protein K469DRAFT_639715 [Zopfia rhizophila CBS 207.26]|uniref:Uncharacterized protein n=1 Tax=Zopfia rhizophila CBS 207.26 TaxID=1314779 RepID=A0A6A6DRS2_9PEZI|nr:hypothetical protein K469DRAFT_639715 [Zopfia rhizophila CBS 207.26]
MAAIGRCTFSLLSGTQEITAGLANFNFDFSMVKVTAPDEYKSIGQHLSKKRKLSAEDGSFHRTARKLGALFDGNLPEVPHLIRAYGLRASEITENPENNPPGSRRHGALEDHVGSDSRAHWAAATSGPSALPLLLLACILAHSWQSGEAISIWNELVTTRKAILRERLNGPNISMNTVTASQLDIAREDLAEWDASARAWLNVADKAKCRQHIQLMLIINNLEMSLNSHLRVYESIMEVWAEAMIAVDQLISGIPLRVQNPHVLVGLSAWHLYPDISILGQEQKLVKLNDHLMTPGGILTIGMQTISPQVPSGISWTLPLKDLRYYGSSKMTRGGFNTSSTNVSFDTFVQVAIGSMISRWGPHASNWHSVAAFLVSFGRKASAKKPDADPKADYMTAFDIGLETPATMDYDDWPRTFWPVAITEQADSYLRGVKHHQRDIEQCINLGKRRFINFFAPVDEHPPPAFGLCDPEHLLGMMSSENAISALRKLATSNDASMNLQHAVVLHRGKGWMEIVGLTPRGNTLTHHTQYPRWVLLRRADYPDDEQHFPVSMRMTHSRAKVSSEPRDYLPSDVMRSFTIMNRLHEACGFVTSFPNVNVQPISWDPFRALGLASECPEFDMHRDGIQEDRVEDTARSWLADARSPSWRPSDYHRVWMFDDFAVYVPASNVPSRYHSDQVLSLDFVTDVLNSDLLDARTIVSRLEKELYIGTQSDPNRRSKYYQSLAILGRVSELYESLQGALVNLSVLWIPLHTVRWIPKYLDPLSLPEAFACIAMFATGHHKLEPRTFSEVIGLSYGNTLYMLEVLLNDPWTCFNSSELKDKLCCLVGNVGKPGLSLLLSVREPMQKEPDLESWNLINHNNFDGKLEDNFRGTALQLSLTGYTQPIDTYEHGTRDKDAFYVETVISIHDHGKWVGDIDILPMYRQGKNLSLDCKCNHTEDERNDFSQLGRLRSVDGWHEFLDPPLDACIIRAHNNWIARLAISAAGSARGYKILIASSHVCWTCVSHISSRKKRSPEQTTVLC